MTFSHRQRIRGNKEIEENNIITTKITMIIKQLHKNTMINKVKH